jgi:prevent-host-death family protein
MSKAWNIVETKAKLSEVLKRANIEPQIIENRGEPIAVILSMEEFNRLSQIAGENKKSATMKDFLRLSKNLSKKIQEEGTELNLPNRNDRKMPKLGE